MLSICVHLNFLFKITNIYKLSTVNYIHACKSCLCLLDSEQSHLSYRSESQELQGSHAAADRQHLGAKRRQAPPEWENLRPSTHRGERRAEGGRTNTWSESMEKYPQDFDSICLPCAVCIKWSMAWRKLKHVWESSPASRRDM